MITEPQSGAGDGGSERDDVSLPTSTIHQRGTLQTDLLYIEKKQFV